MIFGDSDCLHHSFAMVNFSYRVLGAKNLKSVAHSKKFEDNSNFTVIAMISTTKNAKTSFFYFVSNLGCFSMTKGTFSDFNEF
jgi:hypothetical protein